MVIDMHIHTHFSPCSIIDIPQLLRRASDVGLHGICITDHDSVASKSVFESIADRYGICVIVGMEYTTPKGDFLVFGPFDRIPHHMDADELLPWVQREDGVAIPAHPFRHNRPVLTSVLQNSQIVEGLNGRNHPAENGLCNEWLNRQGNGIKQVGGSDAHTLEEVGKIVTVFDKDIHGMNDLLRELRYGNYFPRQMSGW